MLVLWITSLEKVRRRLYQVRCGEVKWGGKGARLGYGEGRLGDWKRGALEEGSVRWLGTPLLPFN